MFVPTSSMGAYYLQPLDERTILLPDDLLCNDKCSVIGVHDVLGGQKRKRS